MLRKMRDMKIFLLLKTIEIRGGNYNFGTEKSISDHFEVILASLCLVSEGMYLNAKKHSRVKNEHYDVISRNMEQPIF